jgi:hypothetical protein
MFLEVKRHLRDMLRSAVRHFSVPTVAIEYASVRETIWLADFLVSNSSMDRAVAFGHAKALAERAITDVIAQHAPIRDGLTRFVFDEPEPNPAPVVTASSEIATISDINAIGISSQDRREDESRPAYIAGCVGLLARTGIVFESYECVVLVVRQFVSDMATTMEHTALAVRVEDKFVLPGTIFFYALGGTEFRFFSWNGLVVTDLLKVARAFLRMIRQMPYPVHLQMGYTVIGQDGPFTARSIDP